MNDIEHSKYCKAGYGISYDQALAKKYQPIVYNPYDYGTEYDPTLYYRIVESDTTKCIQYYYYWKEQNCTKDFTIAETNTVGFLFGLFFAIAEYVIVNLLGYFISNIFQQYSWVQFIAFFLLGALIGDKFHNDINDVKLFQRLAGYFVGRFFTHDFDVEPILVFVKNESIEKVVISGKGDVDAQPHRIDIYATQTHYEEGESEFTVSKFLQPKDKPKDKPKADFKEFEFTRLALDETHARVSIVTCYHAFTAQAKYYDEHVFKKTLEFTIKELRDSVLDSWYEQGFGHDVSDPFDFPYMKFAGELKNKSRPIMIKLLGAFSMIMKGLIMLKSLIIKPKSK